MNTDRPDSPVEDHGYVQVREALPPIAGRESKFMWSQIPPERPMRQVLAELDLDAGDVALAMYAARLTELDQPNNPDACPACGFVAWRPRISGSGVVCNVCHPSPIATQQTITEAA